MNEGGGHGRRAELALGGFVLLVFLTLFGWYATASFHISMLDQRRSVSLLAGPPALAALPMLSPRTVEGAVAAEPLDQATLNVAMVETWRRKPAAFVGPPWRLALGQLGWRNTPALQNLLLFAVRAGEVEPILNGVDALLRRNQVREQATALMNVVEQTPSMRGALVARLATRPIWRGDYLGPSGSSQLRGADQWLARYAVLEALHRRGDRLSRDEVISPVSMLVMSGRSDLAFSLWADVVSPVERPLDDGSFVRLSGQDARVGPPAPFEWQLGVADGVDVGAFHDGNATALSIRWNGRGVPALAWQQTSAPPSRYRLVANIHVDGGAGPRAIGVRMMCGESATLMPLVSQQAGRYIWLAEAPVPCAFSRLELFGQLQNVPTDQDLTITHLSLQRAD